MEKSQEILYEEKCSISVIYGYLSFYVLSYRLWTLGREQ